jgi:hydroxymethylbilane synthase
VATALEERHPELSVELVPIVSRGDREPGQLAEIGGKGLFTQELEAGLLDGSLDLAVHSLKDLPVNSRAGLAVVAHPRRADPRDALVSEVAGYLDALPAGSELLTGAMRRQAQILHRRPELEVTPLRGNINTRLRKWRERGSAGLVLALAGLDRMRHDATFDELPIHPLDPEVMIPAPGQGILALQVRAGGPASEPCAAIDHPETTRAAVAERRIVAAFGGDCTLPLAAWAREADGGLRLTAMIATPDGRRAAFGDATAAGPEEVAEACLEQMRADGAEEILAELRG